MPEDQYPRTWDEFIGQEIVKDQLRVAATSACERGTTLGHILLSSPYPGIGKTALAHLIARTMLAHLHIVSGKFDANAARIAVARMQDGDVLLIDEIHRVFGTSKRDGEWLLHALQDGAIIGPAGVEQLPAITIVGTTTDVARLPDTVVSRFTHRPTLERYSDDEAAQIARLMASRAWSGITTLPEPSDSNIRAIVTAAGGNPRTMRQIITNLLDVAWVEYPDVWGDDGYDLSKPLLWLGLSPDGLDAAAVRYLSILLDKFGGTAGEKIMADALREPAGVRHIERSLLERDLIRLTPKGRVLTSAGIKRAYGGEQQ